MSDTENKVWIVSETFYYETSNVRAVFTTFEKAFEFAKSLAQPSQPWVEKYKSFLGTTSSVDIEDFELNKGE